MKAKIIGLVSLLSFVFVGNYNLLAQENVVDTTVYYNIMYVITTYNGGQFVGEIIKQDDKEISIQTRDRGKVTIPKYEVNEIKEIKNGELNAKGEYIPEEVFSTRYFITTNGLPIKKGEHYVLWNLYGPEIHFGVGKNFGVGLMTSWIGMPIIGSAKYSVQLNEKTSLGLGTLIGTGSWVAPDFVMALPYTAITYGDRRNNINFSGGYGVIAYGGNSDGNALLSIGGMKKVGKKVSIVFDSFIVPQVRFVNSTYNSVTGISTNSTTYSPVALIIPGIRIQGETDKAFQFGFAGVYGNNQFTPIPIPFIQWFRKF